MSILDGFYFWFGAIMAEILIGAVFIVPFIIYLLIAARKEQR